MMAKTVLVIDNEQSFLNAVRLFLADHDYEPISFANAREAIDFLKENASIDAALIDVHMPGVSGVDAAQAVRKISPDISIIMISADHSEENRHRCLQGGADAFIPKPVAPPLLLETLAQLTRPEHDGQSHNGSGKNGSND